MIISERIFARLKELSMTQKEFSGMTGIKPKNSLSLTTMTAIMAVSGILAGCSVNVNIELPEAGTGEYRLPVFETSDFHGTLSLDVNGSNAYPVAYIADKVNDARSAGDGYDSRRVIFLDGGDIYQGNALSFYTEGEAMSAVMDEMEYDAVALGNHEFDWGINKVIDKDGSIRDYTEAGRLVENKIPVVCCNMYKDGEKVDFAQDYVILEKTAISDGGKEKKVRVGVIGFADDYRYSIPGKEFRDLGYSIICDYDYVNGIAKELEDTKDCDATILLAHGAADKVAEALGPESPIDLVLGGHVHKNLCGETSWGLRYLSPANNASAYAYDELVFENDGKGGLRIKADADTGAAILYTYEEGKPETLIPGAENEDEFDREIIGITDEYIIRAKPVMETEIGYITEPVTLEPIEGTDDRITTAGNFVCDALIRGTDADVALINNYSYRTDFALPEGEGRYSVTMGDLFDMLPYDDWLDSYEITYGEFLDVLDFSLNDGYKLYTCMTGIDCYFIDAPKGSSGEEGTKMVDALVKDNELIYYKGKWKKDWDTKKVQILTINFAATTEEGLNGVPNPLFGYIGTDRFLSDDLEERTCVLNGLKEEAAQNDGHLDVDERPHFLYKAYDGVDTIDE